MQTSIFSWRVFLRICFFVLAIGLFVATINNSVLISKGNEKIQAAQLQNLTNLLSSQAAMSAATFIKQNDQDGLFNLVNQIASEKLVTNATVYDSQGRPLATSSNESVREMIGLDTPLGTASIGRQQLVSPIFNDNKHQVGFIRISFERGLVTATSDHYYRNSDHLMYLMIIMSFISGISMTLIGLGKYRTKAETQLLKRLNLVRRLRT